MKTRLLQAYLIAALILGIFSCAPQSSFPPDSPNPLDAPGAVPATAEELHAENLQIIRGIVR